VCQSSPCSSVQAFVQAASSFRSRRSGTAGLERALGHFDDLVECLDLTPRVVEQPVHAGLRDGRLVGHLMKRDHVFQRSASVRGNAHASTTHTTPKWGGAAIRCGEYYSRAAAAAAAPAAVAAAAAAPRGAAAVAAVAARSTPARATPARATPARACSCHS
jgi:hypothetical protein